MTEPLFDSMDVGVIHFTRRIAGQSSRQGSRFLDWVVCDTIANGARRRVGRRGTRGGTIIQFERTYSGGPGERAATVRVLGELTRGGCFALELLLPARSRKKSGMIRDF